MTRRQLLQFTGLAAVAPNAALAAAPALPRRFCFSSFDGARGLFRILSLEVCRGGEWLPELQYDLDRITADQVRFVLTWVAPSKP